MDATSDISTSSSRPSHSISEYTLLEFLGEGATAQVYLAEHEASGARVAIKVIDKLLIQRAQLESKVRQEMVLHSELQHPHVLRVESVFEDARNYYMTLEYCARRSLSAVVKTLPGRKLDEQLVKRLFRQVVAGVVYLHASGVIHRDLKLANLLLTGTGNVKISDFGLAARNGDGHVTMCGTPNFIAPEVLTAEDKPYDEAVDVWSLGCILYCLLFGKPPFEGRKVSETLENVANAGQNPLKFPEGFSSSASDLIKRLLTTDPRSRPSAQQILLHPWLREPHQKKAPSSNRRRKSLPNTPQPVPTHPRAASRSPERLRERRRAAVIRSVKEEAILLSSSSSSVPVVVKPRRRTLEGTRVKSEQHGYFEARSSSMGFSQHQAMQSALVNCSSSSSSSPDDASMDFPDDYSDLSELSLSSTFCARSEQKEANEETEKRHQDDEKPVFNVSSRSADPVVSVIMHFEMEDVSCFGISQNHERSSSQDKIQLQWSCKESAEVGISPTFELKVSNGWEACYDPASGILVVTTAEGDPLRYEIPGVSGARTSSSSSCASSQMQRAHLSPLVRFCQCLALRAMQLRQITLRGHRIKLPFIHYDTLPKSLLASFQHRSSLPRSLHQAASLTNQVSVGQGIAPDGSTRVREEVEVIGVGRGYIDPTGDLRVVFLDGSQLALAASGLQLRFRPSWAPADNAKEDVFELLTTSSMSSFLPSIVKTKLESIPEFIRRLKAAN